MHLFVLKTALLSDKTGLSVEVMDNIGFLLFFFVISDNDCWGCRLHQGLSEGMKSVRKYRFYFTFLMHNLLGYTELCSTSLPQHDLDDLEVENAFIFPPMDH